MSKMTKTTVPAIYDAKAGPDSTGSRSLSVTSAKLKLGLCNKIYNKISSTTSLLQYNKQLKCNARVKGQIDNLAYIDKLTGVVQRLGYATDD